MATLLIVEDDVKTNEAICEYLKSAGHEIIPAYDGAEAVRRFQEEKPDLVVLDIMLPQMTGLLYFLAPQVSLDFSPGSGNGDLILTGQFNLTPYITQMIQIGVLFYPCKQNGGVRYGIYQTGVSIRHKKERQKRPAVPHLACDGNLCADGTFHLENAAGRAAQPAAGLMFL